MIEAKRRGDAVKPDVAYTWLEQLYSDVNRLELLARKHKPGWTVWGNGRYGGGGGTTLLPKHNHEETSAATTIGHILAARPQLWTMRLALLQLARAVSSARIATALAAHLARLRTRLAAQRATRRRGTILIASRNQNGGG